MLSECLCVYVCSNKPSMQIVLWKPPGDFVHSLLSSRQHAASTTITSSHMQQQQQHVADDEDDDELMTDYSDTSQAITELKQHSVLLSPTTTDDTDDMDL